MYSRDDDNEKNKSDQDAEVRSFVFDEDEGERFEIGSFVEPEFQSQKKSIPQQPPKKAVSAGSWKIWLGVLVAAAVLVLTWYGLTKRFAETEIALPVAPPVVAANGADAPAPRLPGLMEKAPDAVDFSPTPEMYAADEPDMSDSLSTAAAAAALEPAGADEEMEAGAPRPAIVKKSEAKAAKPKGAGAQSAEVEKIAPQAQTRATEAAEPKAAAAEAAEPKAAASEAAEPKVAAPEAATPRALEISKLWAVNIASTTNANESMRILSNILGRDVGGQIYTYETVIDGKPHYRIRVGFFETKDEAEAVGRKIAADFKLSSPPWAVQPTVEEAGRVRRDG
ncbi:MAG: SPOR domain-containing protein [Candidatus Adiutrix sp.]|jgi:hypothetical protein|nr:SPOR domain-containing protein [Candidatus Adiutrix sp.]